MPVSAERLLVLGDSLSDAYQMPSEAGWVSLLQQRLGDDFTVINASISGETTAGGMHRIETLLKRHEPDFVLIELGGNDGLRGLSPRQLEQNLEAIITRVLAADAMPILMQIRLPGNLGPVYLERFEAVYPALAKRHEIALVSFFLDGIFDQPGMMMADGIHPTIEAQPLMLERLWPELKPILDLSEG